MPAVVADTHAVLWMLLDSPRLSSPARAALQGAVESDSPIYLSAISLVEVVYLVDKGRLPEAAWERLRDTVGNPASGLVVLPLDQDIADTLRRVPLDQIPDMPDRIIAATALSMQLPLVTRDHKIQSSQLETIW